MICEPCKKGEHAYCEYPPTQAEIEAAAEEMLVTQFLDPKTGLPREYRGKGCTCEHRLRTGVIETGNSKAVSNVKPVEPTTGNKIL